MPTNITAEPDYFATPGEILQETIDTLGISQKELADRTGKHKKTINEIIQGKSAITPDVALCLEMVTQVPASFWLKLCDQYHIFIAKKKKEEELLRAKQFVKNFPYAELVKRGYCIDTTDESRQIDAIYRFFGVTGQKEYIDTYESNLLGAAKAQTIYQWDKPSLSAWLRMGELKTSKINTLTYNKESLKKAIPEIRKLTNQHPKKILPALVDILSHVGIALVIVPELKNTHIHGFTRWLTPQKAVIQLSCRGKRIDHFWFTLFHEIAHLLKHGKNKIFIHPDTKESQKDTEEEEADQYSADILIPPSAWKQFITRPNYCKWNSIEMFARQQGVYVDVVLGRLHRNQCLPYPTFAKKYTPLNPEELQ